MPAALSKISLTHFSGICRNYKTSGAECCEKRRAHQHQPRHCQTSNVSLKNLSAALCGLPGPLPSSPSFAVCPLTSSLRSHSDVHMVMVSTRMRSNLLLTISSGGEYQDHVNRMQPVRYPPHHSHAPLKQTTCSFVQDLSFRASLVCADQEAADATGAHADAACGALSSAAGIKRKRARTSGGRDLPASLSSVDTMGAAGGDGREKALELKGSHIR